MDNADLAQQDGPDAVPRCLCASTCPVHGNVGTNDLTRLRSDIINLAIKLEQDARESEAQSIGDVVAAMGRFGAPAVWFLLGECMCRSHRCSHPASFHSNGKCRLCFSLYASQEVCWR